MDVGTVSGAQRARTLLTNVSCELLVIDSEAFNDRTHAKTPNCVQSFGRQRRQGKLMPKRTGWTPKQKGLPGWTPL
jgi:hypothetical protein